MRLQHRCYEQSSHMTIFLLRNICSRIYSKFSLKDLILKSLKNEELNFNEYEYYQIVRKIYLTYTIDTHIQATSQMHTHPVPRLPNGSSFLQPNLLNNCSDAVLPSTM